MLPLDAASTSELLPLSRIRLIVADLDGTFLDPTWAVVDLLQTMLPRLQRRGVRFTIATGRAFGGVANIMPRLALPPRTPIALYNGSLCVDAGLRNVLRSRFVAATAARRVVRSALAAGLPALCYPNIQLINGELRESPMGFTPDGKAPPHAEPNGYDVRWLGPESVASLPDCLALLVDLRSAGSSTTSFDLVADGEFSITQSGAGFIEVRPIASDKGYAVDAIARQLGVSLEHVLAIGDNDNDIEMLRTCAVGVAVGNASDRLRHVARYTTTRPSAQGCLQVMRLVIAAHRYHTPSEDGGQ